MNVINKLTIQVARTADGIGEYVQIMSNDMLTVSVVLIATEIEIEDDRDD